MENEVRRTYLEIGSIKRVDIQVYLDDKEVYSGISDDAPEDIKKLKYSKTTQENKMNLYVYSDLNWCWYIF